ncbi:DUF3306 domain-containing protein [Roseibium algae]|uniref:DUF3306 domain-containing protein n=1 Tax=Roseibium algae TaxID=3123038 RepID=A0ABU8TIZ5_9HYPH
MTRDEDTSGEGFLQRWSRRKSGTLTEVEIAEEAAVQAVQLPEADGDTDVEPEEDPELAANREAAEAVDIDALTYESDFTLFMKNGVPEAVKNAALRKLWRSNPVLAVLDGLNDYDEDFRLAEGAVNHYASAWKVGRGYADKAEQVTADMEEKSARLAAERERLASGDAQEPSDVSVERAEDLPDADQPLNEIADEDEHAETDEQLVSDDDIASEAQPMDGELGAELQSELAELQPEDTLMETPIENKRPSQNRTSRRRMSFTTE